ncbi:endonuclease dU [Halorubrum tebenquichense]|uniref:DUF99 family protein n=1 Tax=Halorubrum tebenquichense DSM 14210 TaxID=1227485 RepID=M0DQU3_9EURY|nr:DUF99 family protein [Halorubrum tebenquichense]ELZ37218.1 hypothetical protein C472_08866 [Halorubrum tebenquichense DSM 14210]
MRTPPSRTLGVAFSDGRDASRAAGVVARADGTPDGFAFAECAVGGTDATDAVIDCWRALGREDVRHVACAGVAPAWFNLLDLDRLAETVDRPVYAVSYEASPGLEPALREAFDGDPLADRLAVYRSLPPRVPVAPAAGGDGEAGERADGDAIDDADDRDPRFVRAVGVDPERAAAAVRALTRDGFRRCEPLRIAALAASAHREAVAAE